MVNFVVVFIAVIVYIYSAVCLQRIAEKVNAKNIWLAWIPIASVLLI